MQLIPEDILLNHVYEYLLGREYAFINKSAYIKYLQWIIKSYGDFQLGVCSKESCGHKNANILLKWKDNFRIVNNQPHYNEKTTKVCLYCFSLSIYKYMKQYMTVPWNNYCGIEIYNKITCFRQVYFSSNKYINWVESEYFQDFRKMNITEFTIQQNHKNENEKLLNKILVKIKINNKKYHIRNCEKDIELAKKKIENYKSELEELEKILETTDGHNDNQD